MKGGSSLGLAGDTALIVGAGNGIGRATAILLARAGAHAVLLDRHLDRAESVAGEIREAGGTASIVCADLADPTRVAGALEEAESGTKGLDILVNITGSASWRPLLEMDATTWDRDMRVNLTSHLQINRRMASRWRDQKRPGVVCVVASISGLFGASNHAAYGAAKAGLLSFVRSAAEEWAPFGIRINAVVPGSVRTPRIEATLMTANPDTASAELLARMAKPDDVAGPIAYLVSATARRVTGQTLVVDGGTSTRFPYALG